MMGATPPETEDSEFVEVDPTGRYGRYNEILGKGASKTVYRGFDEYEGIEVAWNQVKLYDFLQSPEDLERLYCEIHLLKTLKHKNIMKFYTSWVDPANRNLNFVTEMFTSGTLRQYRQKHRRVNIRAVKHWCRQILRGLLYLHTLDPPVIHRDLKCDNIFVNGNQGEVKIGDLGLAAILRKSHAAHCVGTPEFMAPEVFEEEYNELVDIYSFGMCLLEMVTFEYPYSECTHPAQIYKKVISGKKPDALYRVKDPEVRQFVEKCLATVSERFSARELLKDPFLQIDEFEFDSRMSEHQCEMYDNPQLLQPLSTHQSSSSLISWYSDHDTENGWGYDEIGIEPHGYEIFSNEDDEPSTKLDISIKGKQRDDEHIFLRLRIADKDGRVRNIYFPFDVQTDTALNVATEMVAELDLTDQDVTKIANMIDGEIASLVPEWKTRASIGDIFSSSCLHYVSNDSSNVSLCDYISSNNPNGKNVCPCTRLECASSHGRFEEITYQDEGSEHGVTEGASVVSSQSDCLQSTDFWSVQEGPEFTLEGSDKTLSNEESDHMVQQTSTDSENLIPLGKHCETSPRKSTSHTQCSLIDQFPVSTYAFSDDNEIEMRQKLRWLNAKYQIELRELKSQQLGGTHKTLPSSPAFQRKEHRMEDGIKAGCSSHFDRENSTVVLNSFASGNNLSSNSPAHSRNISESSYPDSDMQRAPRCKEIQKHESRPVHMLVAEGFYSGGVIPHSHHRARSLPVDAVNV